MMRHGDIKTTMSYGDPKIDKQRVRDGEEERRHDDPKTNCLAGRSSPIGPDSLCRKHGSNGMSMIHTTLPAPKIRQIDGIQILRAVAVFLVTWLHAGQALGPWRVVELPHFMAFGIDIFFVISGFIMASVLLRNTETAGQFFKRRLVRIFPIYWMFAFMVYARLAHSQGSLLLNYLPSFLLLPGLYPRFPLLLAVSWTLVFEMFFYYTLSVILLFTKRAVPAATVVLGIAAFIPGPPVLTSPILLEFVAGMVVATAFYRLGGRRWGIFLLLAGTAIALYMQAHPEQAGAQGIDLVLASKAGVMRRVLTWGISATLIVAGMVFWSPSTQNPPARIAVAVGNSSYSAYLLSSIMIEFTCRVLIRLVRPSLAAEVVFQVLIVAIVLFAGWVSYQFLEWPMIRWLNNLRLQVAWDRFKRRCFRNPEETFEHW
jgi:exopolysaccharide production protein ExoZ